MSRSIVVTGAAGFLGSWVTKQLLKEGWDVTAFDRAADDSKLRRIAGDGAADRVTWASGDIADTQTVASVIANARPDRVIHLAAVLIPVCKDDPVTGAKIDVIGHINVMEAAGDAGCGLFVYASSGAATARAPDGTLFTVYGTFKHWNEEYSATRWRDRGIASIGLRPAVVYGPGREVGATAFVNAAITDVVAGKPHQLTTRWRHRVEYVEEIADAFCRCAALDVEGSHACDLTTEVTDEADLIAVLKDQVPDCEILEPQGNRGFREPLPSDTGPLEALIGPRNHVGLAEGVSRTIAIMRGRQP
jgi:UDP-glucose 4-epimerase